MEDTSVSIEQRLAGALSAPTRDEGSENIWTGGPVALPRGRSAKDPEAKTTTCHCSSLEEFESGLREFLKNPPGPPEHSTCELILWVGTPIDVVLPRPELGPVPSEQRRQEAAQDGNTEIVQAGPGPPVPAERMTITASDAMAPTHNQKDAMKIQRSYAKAIVEAIQKVDGFRYSFHNNWRSGEDAAYRFSYYCNDSLLNKDRVANGKVGTEGKRAMKPIYDCRGHLSVKFSSVKKCVEVLYKHIPLHKTYEERAPRPRKESKRARLMALSGQSLENYRVGKQRSEARKERRRRKKKERQDAAAGNTAENELRMQSLHSLLELIRPEPTVDEAPTAPTADENVNDQGASAQADAQPGAQAPKRPSSSKPRPKNSCEICRAKKYKCNGAKPRCNRCARSDWPCFYMEKGADGEDRVVSVADDPEPALGAGQEESDESDDENGLDMEAQITAAKTTVEEAWNNLAKAERRVKRLEIKKTKEDEARRKTAAQEAAQRALERNPPTVASEIPRSSRSLHHDQLFDAAVARVIAQSQQQGQQYTSPYSEPFPPNPHPIHTTFLNQNQFIEEPTQSSRYSATSRLFQPHPDQSQGHSQNATTSMPQISQAARTSMQTPIQYMEDPISGRFTPSFPILPPTRGTPLTPSSSSRLPPTPTQPQIQNSLYPTQWGSTDTSYGYRMPSAPTQHVGYNHSPTQNSQPSLLDAYRMTAASR